MSLGKGVLRCILTHWTKPILETDRLTMQSSDLNHYIIPHLLPKKLSRFMHLNEMCTYSKHIKKFRSYIHYKNRHSSSSSSSSWIIKSSQITHGTCEFSVTLATRIATLAISCATFNIGLGRQEASQWKGEFQLLYSLLKQRHRAMKVVPVPDHVPLRQSVRQGEMRVWLSGRVDPLQAWFILASTVILFLFYNFRWEAIYSVPYVIVWWQWWRCVDGDDGGGAIVVLNLSSSLLLLSLLL